ncbi:MAG: FxLYD domain-containing protein [Planctomycetes bacterium]|jgi:hypothetical protein|nr:FxLYD domain-containing protein [Planctomycetota bacterium]
MARAFIIVLTASLVSLAGGCRTFRPAGKASLPGQPRQGQPTSASASGGSATGSTGPCLVQHGFAILTFRAVRDDYGQVSVIGEIKNAGPARQGVELQAALRDAGGRVVAVGHFYPAAYRNIVPGETWPFTYSFGRQADAVGAELRIVGTFRTMDILSAASPTPR